MKRKVTKHTAILLSILLSMNPLYAWAETDQAQEDPQLFSVSSASLSNTVIQDEPPSDVVEEMPSPEALDSPSLLTEGMYDPDNVLLQGNVLYGNGNPLIIKRDGDGQVYVFDGSGESRLSETPIAAPETLTIYGGGKNVSLAKDVDITVDGVKVKDIYGGGYAADGSCSLNGQVKITLQNGASAANLYGGGYLCSVTGNIDIRLDGSSTLVTSLYGGGYNGTVDGDVNIVLQDSRATSCLYGGGYSNGNGSGDVSGDIAILVDGRTEVKKAYGGGYAYASAKDASANVGGSISFSIPALPRDPIGPDDHNSDAGATQYYCHGDIYGAGYAYAANGHTASATCQSVDLYVNSVEKTITGGGYAQTSGNGCHAVASVAQDIGVELNQTDIRDAYIGGRAIGSGAEANSRSVDVRVENGNELGSFCCGGTAQSGGISKVSGAVSAIIKNCSNINGEFYGGGSAASNSTATCGSVNVSISDSALPAYEQFADYVVSANIYGGGNANGSNANASIAQDITLNLRRLQCAGYILCGGDAKGGGDATCQKVTADLHDLAGYEYKEVNYLPSVVTAIEWDANSGTSAAPTVSSSISITDSICNDVWGGKLFKGSSPLSTTCPAYLVLGNTDIVNTVTCFDSITLDSPLKLTTFLYKDPDQPTLLLPQGFPLGAPLVYCDDTEVDGIWFKVNEPAVLSYQVEDGRSVWRLKDDGKTHLIPSKDSLLMNVGDESLLSVSADTSASWEDIEWSSDTPTVASVDMNGIVKALSTGSAAITAQIVGTDIQASCQVEVAQEIPLDANAAVVVEEVLDTDKTDRDTQKLLEDNPIYANAFSGVDPSSRVIREIFLKNRDNGNPIPVNGNITLLIPYAEISSSIDQGNYMHYVFSILHLLYPSGEQQPNGQLVHYRALPQGLEITVNSLSPFLIGFKEATKANGFLHTLSFQTGDGSVLKPQLVAENALASEPAAPVKSGCTFQGWYRDSGCTQAWTFSKDAVLQDTTLYAKWQSASPPTPVYTVTFDTQGGSQVNAMAVAAGGKISEPSAPVREDYSFTGWFKESACANAWDFSQDIVSQNTTLFAGWEPVSQPQPLPEKPAAPRLSVKSNTTTAITLAWNKIEDASGYVIYGYDRQEMKDITERKIVSPSRTSLVLKYPQGTSRSYYIRAYKTVNGKNLYSKVSEKAVTATKPDAAVIKSITAGKGTAYVVLKARAKGAVGYAYCASTDGRNYRIVAKGPKMPYKMKGLKKGKNYIKVRSYTTDHNGKTIYGAWSKVITVTIK